MCDDQVLFVFSCRVITLNIASDNFFVAQNQNEDFLAGSIFGSSKKSSSPKNPLLEKFSFFYNFAKKSSFAEAEV